MEATLFGVVACQQNYSRHVCVLPDTENIGCGEHTLFPYPWFTRFVRTETDQTIFPDISTSSFSKENLYRAFIIKVHWVGSMQCCKTFSEQEHFEQLPQRQKTSLLDEQHCQSWTESWLLSSILSLPSSLWKWIQYSIRGCPHITSANFGGFQTPPPPLVSLRQHLADPPSINAFKENTLFDMKW